MERLHHLLHLGDAGRRIGWPRGIGAFWSIVVLRVVAPVVLVERRLGLVYAVVVVGGEDVYVGHSEFLQVVDAGLVAENRASCLLGEGEELAFVGDSGGGMNGEVAVVHLVEHGVGDGLRGRTFVSLPPLGVGGGEVDDGPAVAVHADGLGPDAGGFGEPFAVLLNAEGVELAVGHRRERCRPCAAVGRLHLYGLRRGGGVGVVVDIQAYG